MVFFFLTHAFNLQRGRKEENMCTILISSETSSNLMGGRQTPHPPIHLIALQCLLGPRFSFYYLRQQLLQP